MKSFKILTIVTLLSSFTTLANAGQVPVLECFGTEPFWSLSTDAKGFLSLNDLRSDTKKFYSKTTMKSAEGTTGTFAFQIEAKDMLNNTLKLNIVQASCNDGMSDDVYPYTALVDVDGGILFGCCE